MSDRRQGTHTPKFLEEEESAAGTPARALRDLVEGSFPLPLSVTFRQLRLLRDAPAKERLPKLIDVFEMLIKYQAALACKYYLLEHGQSDTINERLQEFNSVGGQDRMLLPN